MAGPVRIDEQVMAKEPTLLYVIGAAKAGTSWLYQYFRYHGDCHFRSIKELHFFDRAQSDRAEEDVEDLAARQVMLQERIARAVPQDRVRIETEIADLAALRAVLVSEGDQTAAYLDYLRNGSEGRKLIGDITPAYALLPVEELQRMAGLCPDTRFIYIMRDPVERLWSHVRMKIARRNPGEAFKPRAARHLMWRVLRGEQQAISARGDYRAAIEKLKAAIDPRRVLLVFTEEMFTPSGIRKICAFLGIGYVAPEIEKPVHKGVELAMRPGQRAMAREFLAPQYDYIEQLFGRLPKAWQSEPAEV